MVLSKLTGWTLSDILNLTVAEIGEWTRAATDVQKQINKATSR